MLTISAFCWKYPKQKGVNYQHLTASTYVCLYLCASENRPSEVRCYDKNKRIDLKEDFIMQVCPQTFIYIFAWSILFPRATFFKSPAVKNFATNLFQCTSLKPVFNFDSFLLICTYFVLRARDMASVPYLLFHLANYKEPYQRCGGRRGGLMVCALDSGPSGPGWSPGRGQYFVFLGKTLYSHSASLHPGV